MSLTFDDAKVSMPAQTYALFSEFSIQADFSRWTLVGGTALALYLRHRTSEDLDFFTEEKVFGFGSLRWIEALLDARREQGDNVVTLLNEENQHDYEVSGVKLTFHAAGLQHLRTGCDEIGNIAIASVELIAAMKIHAVLKYRTLTRDFFDLYSLCRLQGYDLYSLLDNYRIFYGSHFAGNLLEQRFFDRAQDTNDPEFSNLKVIEPKSLDEVRSYFEQWLILRYDEESSYIKQVIKERDVKDSPFTSFGLLRYSLFQKLALMGESELLLFFLGVHTADLAYEALSGQNLIDLYLDDIPMIEKILHFSTKIPEHWLNGRRYKHHELVLEMLRYENSVIIQAEAKADTAKIERVAQKKEYDPAKFIERVEAKRAFLTQVRPPLF